MNPTTCKSCGLPIFHGPAGYAGPQCMCRWTNAAPRQPDSNPFFDNRIARELLEDRAKQWPMSAPRQPEGEGLEVVAYMVGRYTTDQRESAETFALHHAGGVTELCRLSDHLRAIAELREECERLRQQLVERDAECCGLRKERDSLLQQSVGDAGYLLAAIQQRDKLAGLLRMVRQDGWYHPLEEHEIAQIDAALAEVKP